MKNKKIETKQQTKKGKNSEGILLRKKKRRNKGRKKENGKEKASIFKNLVF